MLRHTYITHLLFGNIFTATVLTEKTVKMNDCSMVHYTSIQELPQRHGSWVRDRSGCKVLMLPPPLLQELRTTTDNFCQYSGILNRLTPVPVLSWKLHDLALSSLTLTKLNNATTTDNATELTQAKVNLISHIWKPLYSPSVNTIGQIQHSYDMLTKLI
jgi:hypothetical protein